MHDGEVNKGMIDRAFGYDCDGCERLSFDEKKAVDNVARRVVDAVKEILDKPILGHFVKPLARPILHGFVRELVGRNLNGKHIGHVAREVYVRLEELLDAKK